MNVHPTFVQVEFVQVLVHQDIREAEVHVLYLMEVGLCRMARALQTTATQAFTTAMQGTITAVKTLIIAAASQLQTIINVQENSPKTAIVIPSVRV